jgi:hypothetical protein
MRRFARRVTDNSMAGIYKTKSEACSETSAGKAALADKLERIRVARLRFGIDLGKVDKPKSLPAEA